MNIAYFSGSSFTIPLLDAIYTSQNMTLREVAYTQLAYIQTISQEECVILPQWWNEYEAILHELDTCTLSVLDEPVHINYVVTKPRAFHRGKEIPHPVCDYALHNEIPCMTPHTMREYYESVHNSAIDAFYVASFGVIIPQYVLDIPRYGCINWHPSKVPLYRGASPMQSVLCNGDTMTALSWLEMTAEMDAGDILLQIPYRVEPTLIYPQLQDAMISLGAHTWSLPLVCKLMQQYTHS